VIGDVAITLENPVYQYIVAPKYAQKFDKNLIKIVSNPIYFQLQFEAYLTNHNFNKFKFKLYYCFNIILKWSFDKFYFAIAMMYPLIAETEQETERAYRCF
jgi:hypothetical protein